MVNYSGMQLTIFTVVKSLSDKSIRTCARVATLIVNTVGILNTQIQLVCTLINVWGNNNTL